MPEHAEPSVADLAVLVGLDGVVHAEVLMVPGEDLRSRAVVMVEQYEVLKQVEQILLLADTHEHGLKGDATGVGLGASASTRGRTRRGCRVFRPWTQGRWRA